MSTNRTLSAPASSSDSELKEIAMRRQRHAKIVATLGPATSDPKIIRALFDAGADVFRFNFSHGSHSEHQARYEIVREIERETGRPIAVLADLQGPKLRLGRMANGSIDLAKGESIRLDLDPALGTRQRVPIPHPEVFAALAPGVELLIDDGRIRFEVEEASKSEARVHVKVGGKLSDRKGVSVVGAVLPLSAMTDKDRTDLAFALGMGADWIALSFVQRPEDLDNLRLLAGRPVWVITKLEKPSAVERLDEIVARSDAVMVARGDLGVEMPPQKVPTIQRQVLRACRHAGKPVVIATQMLESMVTASTPTRAEVTDVANAVLDGSSALMLSGETAIGVDPVGVVATMARITMRAEREFDFLGWGSRLGVQTVADGATSPAGITAAISAAGWRAAVDEAADVIIACTLTGRTARSISRFRPNMQLVATTPSPRTARQLTLSWGVETLLVPLSSSTDVIVDRAVRAAAEAGYVEAGDIAVVLAGSPGVPEPTSDTLRLVLVD